MSDSSSTIRNGPSTESGEITLSQVLSSVFYLATLAVIVYYLWVWWQNTKRLKENIRVAVANFKTDHKVKEGFSNPDAGDPLALEVPKATQAKSPCPVNNSANLVEPVWDGADGEHILFDESNRKWSDTKLEGDNYTTEVNLAFSNLKNKYTQKIEEKIKESLTNFENAKLTNFISTLNNLDNPITGDNKIAQLKGLLGIQIINLKAIVINIESIINVSGTDGNKYRELWARQDDAGQSYIPEWAQSELSKEAIVRRIIRVDILREYIEKFMENLGDKDTINIYNLVFKPPYTIGKECINISLKLIASYEELLPVVDAIIGLRAAYSKERQDIQDLVADIPFGKLENSQVMETDASPGQVPKNLINSNTTRLDPLGRLGRYPDRYWLNKWSGKKYEVTRELDSDLSGLSDEDFKQKYDWVDKVGKDVMSVPNDPEIKYLLPPNMRTIPDILSDYDHYNANCQRIYGECSARTDVPGFPLPNWQPEDYYKYLDRLPSASDAAKGITPVIS